MHLKYPTHSTTTQHSPMPNQRDPDKTKLNFWITSEERELIRKDMEKLGIETYTDYILYKCGIDREDESDNK